MAYEEKGAWVGLIVGIITFIVYLSVLLARAAGGPLEQAPYVDALLLTGIDEVNIARGVLEHVAVGEGDVRFAEVGLLDHPHAVADRGN
ncbi:MULTISPECIES: hypothetical protein [Microcella]|uniref:hypothetical protein n=1 Tax=Microcella TaxID=337004 RepID=UPI0015CF819E|nr:MULTISPECIES: hypothetical protein [Microcella]QOD94386.1 hypothetical protein IE160_04035 [Chryseoglobus sp. 28M-23]